MTSTFCFDSVFPALVSQPLPQFQVQLTGPDSGHTIFLFALSTSRGDDGLLLLVISGCLTILCLAFQNFYPFVINSLCWTI